MSPSSSSSESVATAASAGVASGLVPMPTDRERWFAQEVQPHSSTLRRYLRSSFPGVRDVDDVVQESYLRLWRARAAAPVRSAKAFLFRIARHVAIDLVRHQQRSPLQRVPDLAALRVPEEAPAPHERLEREEKVRLLAEAIDALPERCREVVLLRKFELLPTREVATRLGMAERAVEKQLERGVERCRTFLEQRGVQSFFTGER